MREKWLHFCEDCQQEITRGKLWNRVLFPKTQHAIWYFLHAAILKTRHTGNGDTSWTFFYLRHRHHHWHHVLNTHGHLLDLTCLRCTELASAAQSWWKPSGPYPECKRINEFCHSVHVLAIMLCYVILCYVSHLGYHPSSFFSLLTCQPFNLECHRSLFSPTSMSFLWCRHLVFCEEQYWQRFIATGQGKSWRHPWKPVACIMDSDLY